MSKTCRERAQIVFDTLTSDPDLMTEGRRNNDAIDLLIALGVLDEPLMEATLHMTVDAADEFADRAEIMLPYVRNYCAIGQEYALSKLVGNYKFE